jgi:DNA-binding LytR/AlgR family response regulator
MSYKCILVDDEPLAIGVLEGFLKHLPNIEVVATFNEALPLFDFLQQNQVDFIFLDIEMPNLSGIDFLKCLKDPPFVIITSANRDYAIDGYELNVVDYILKPLTMERLVRAVNKAVEAVSLKAKNLPETSDDEFIFLKENKKYIRVKIDEILYIESIKDYTKVVTEGKTIVTRMNISAFEKMLDPAEFIRVHRSYIISRKHIDAYTATSVEIGSVEIPVGRLYRDEAVRRLGYDFDM